ncbi:hypothetical protein BV898_13054 [Hypsibius exemplaris]|uniref:Major facilitator superfamily associated domain-containing protein n=1 Tax=Hypsibius exemplaris TaxID=2072580 RepID=A0A1W0WBZ4_HYPEX|nr:hypothetical protein BV898_13054 [Hypsibius exemplaris]
MVAEKSVSFAAVKAESVELIKKESAHVDKPILPLNASFRKDKPAKPKFINPRLLPVKLLTFLIHGGQSATFAFVGLHMKSLGISVTEIAVVLLLMPILTSAGPPLSGFLADRFGNYKLVLIAFTMLSAIFSTCMWFLVPSFGVTVDPALLRPVNVTVNLPCLYEGLTSGNLTDFSNSFRPDKFGLSWNACEARCAGEGSATTDPRLCYVEVSAPRVGGSRTKTCITHTRFSMAEAIHISEEDMHNSLPPILSLSCEIESLLNTNNQMSNEIPSCTVTCRNATASQADGTTTNGVPFGNKALTITLYFIFRFLSYTASRGVFPLLDAAIMQISRQEGGDFGIQRLFASVGAVVVPPFAGWLTLVASRHCHCMDFSPAFYLFGILTVLGGVLMYFMDIRVKQPETHIFRTMGIVLRDPNVVGFLCAVFFSGAAWGFVNGYLFIFLKDDDGFPQKNEDGSPVVTTTFYLGLVNGAGYLAGIPFLFFSTKLAKIFGHENLVATVLFAYAARFLIYSFTYNPYLIFPTELITGVTFLVFALMPQFAVKTAPKYMATLMGLFGAANFGIGGGVGPLIGGFLIHGVGFRTTFQILAVSMAAIGCAYFLTFHFVLKRLAAQAQKPKSPLIVHKRDIGNGNGSIPPPIQEEPAEA